MTDGRFLFCDNNELNVNSSYINSLDSKIQKVIA